MLYICPTPIGNLQDITLRVLNVLKSSDEIGCEDTRISAKLLTHFEIRKPLFSYREHNEKKVTKNIVEKLIAGQNIAIISDAGMPGISDPGEVLIKTCIEKQLDYTVLPGPSAVITALVGSNLVTQPFYYHGFIDRNKTKQILDGLSRITATLVFYESPHRLKKTLLVMLDRLGDRNITIARELTKKYETYLHTTLKQAVNYYQHNVPRGEYVLIIAGHQEEISKLNFEQVVALAKMRIATGERHKDVVKELAKIHSVNRSELYKETI